MRIPNNRQFPFTCALSSDIELSLILCYLFTSLGQVFLGVFSGLDQPEQPSRRVAHSQVCNLRNSLSQNKLSLVPSCSLPALQSHICLRGYAMNQAGEQTRLKANIGPHLISHLTELQTVEEIGDLFFQWQCYLKLLSTL